MRFGDLITGRKVCRLPDSTWQLLPRQSLSYRREFCSPSDETWLPKIGGTCIFFNLSIDANSTLHHPQRKPSLPLDKTLQLLHLYPIGLSDLCGGNYTYKASTGWGLPMIQNNPPTQHPSRYITKNLGWPPLYNYTTTPWWSALPEMGCNLNGGKADHKVDLHTHSPDKYNIGRDSQLLESKARGTSVKTSKKADGKTQWMWLTTYRALHGGVKLRKRPSPESQ